MKLDKALADKPIVEVLETEPEIGVILERYGIGCVKCSIGTCLLKDVVAVHFLGDEIEALIEKEINAHLAGRPVTILKKPELLEAHPCTG